MYLIVPSGLILVVPCAPWVALVNVRVSPFGSVSFDRTLTFIAVFTGVVSVSFTATGEPLTMVTVTVAVAVPPFPSEIV